MMNTIGIIFSNYCTDSLQGIAQDRPFAAVPFGGRYRLLDFTLSSMVNSGLRTVGIITSYRYRPILDHLGAGKEWSLDRKAGGLFILPGSNHGLSGRNIRFALKDLQLNIEFLEKDYADNVILSGCDQVLKINFQNAVKFHEDKQADVTLVYKEFQAFSPESKNRIYLEVSPEGEVRGMFKEEQEGIKFAGRHKKEMRKCFIDMVIIKRKLLMEIIEGYEFIENMDLLDVVKENLKILRVYAYPFKGYLGRIYSVSSYFKHNMELLDPDIRSELFMGKDKIHTKIKDNPPTRYGSKALVKNCLIASGCRIEGRVEKSIIFRGVQISSGAEITNSIIMQKCVIGKEVVLENVILDKFVRIKDYTVLKGKENSPVVINKRAVV